MPEPLTFTQDWTRQFRRNATIFGQYLEKPGARYLEIGVFEGRSGCHVLSAYPTLQYTGIDLWQPSGLSPVYYPSDDDAAAGEIEARARRNLERFQGRVRLMKGQATRCASELLEAGERFDFVYVDAAHFALNVVAEAAVCWQMLEVGGAMLFDDYGDRGVRRSTKSGGEAFLGLVSFKEVFRNHQLCIVKTAESQSQPLYRKARMPQPPAAPLPASASVLTPASSRSR